MQYNAITTYQCVKSKIGHGSWGSHSEWLLLTTCLVSDPLAYAFTFKFSIQATNYMFYATLGWSEDTNMKTYWKHQYPWEDTQLLQNYMPQIKK